MDDLPPGIKKKERKGALGKKMASLFGQDTELDHEKGGTPPDRGPIRPSLGLARKVRIDDSLPDLEDPLEDDIKDDYTYLLDLDDEVKKEKDPLAIPISKPSSSEPHKDVVTGRTYNDLVLLIPDPQLAKLVSGRVLKRQNP